MRYKRKRDKCFWTMARSYLHDYMPAIRNLSGKTIETYKQSLKTYLRFLKEKKNIEDELVSFEAFTRDYVKEFIIWLKGQGASTRTINLRITSIRSFLKYCGQEDFELRGIYESVCQIQKLKEEKHPILYLQPEATAAILSAYDMNTQKHRRNRMILISAMLINIWAISRDSFTVSRSSSSVMRVPSVQQRTFSSVAVRRTAFS